MTPESQKTKRLIALFLFGFVLLNYPILSLLDIDAAVFGFPLLYIYVFGVWGFLIFLAALVMSRTDERIEKFEKSVK